MRWDHKHPSTRVTMSLRAGNIFYRDLLDCFWGKGPVQAFLLILVTAALSENGVLDDVLERINVHMLW